MTDEQRAAYERVRAAQDMLQHKVGDLHDLHPEEPAYFPTVTISAADRAVLVALVEELEAQHTNRGESVQAQAKYYRAAEDECSALRAENEDLRKREKVLMDVYEAAWKDECKSTYCALQRGGLVHRPLMAAHELVGEPGGGA